MFHHSAKQQDDRRVDTPDPRFAKPPRRAIGGVKGEGTYTTLTKAR